MVFGLGVPQSISGPCLNCIGIARNLLGVVCRSAHSFNFTKTTITEVLEADENSPLFKTGIYVRRPVEIEGRVMGRLMPGFRLDHNFVIENDGVSLVALWEALTIIGQLQFAIFDLPKFENQRVRIKGWISRVPVSVLRVYSVSQSHLKDGSAKLPKNRKNRGCHGLSTELLRLPSCFPFLSLGLLLYCSLFRTLKPYMDCSIKHKILSKIDLATL